MIVTLAEQPIPTELLDWLQTAAPAVAAEIQATADPASRWNKVRAWLATSSTELPGSVLSAVLSAALGGA